ncbi:MAG: leucine-rich repeat domain-containing protein, partial [Flavobacteriales bacterium]
TYTVPYLLSFINVSNNAITHLDLSNANNLSGVTAHHNQITTITWPGGPWLSQVDVSYNQLTALGNAYLPFISTLDISHNNFTAVPYTWEVGFLNASWNQITDISQLHGSSNYFEVDLSHNAIVQVPNLGNARIVDLSFNPLTQGIAETNYVLQTLRVNNTQLPCLPYLHNALVNLYCANSPINCIPNQPAGLVMSQANFGFAPVLCSAASPCYASPSSLDLRVFLQGPYDPVTHLMRDDLRAQGLLPATDPYPALGVTYAGNGWPDVFDPAVLQVSGPDAIVDWIVVDMIPNNGVPNPGDAQAYGRPALVQRDGDVVGLDGTWPLPLIINRGSYRTRVRHRNHLGATVKFGEGFNGGVAQVDFTSYAATACFNGAMHGDSLLADDRQLWSGDVTYNHQLKYVGAGNDRDPILVALGSPEPTTVVTGVYAREDVNMDGVIKYMGANNDRDPILQNIGGNTPLQVRNQVGFQ